MNTPSPAPYTGPVTPNHPAFHAPVHDLAFTGSMPLWPALLLAAALLAFGAIMIIRARRSRRA